MSRRFVPGASFFTTGEALNRPYRPGGPAGEGLRGPDAHKEPLGERTDPREAQSESPCPCRDPESTPGEADGVWEVGMLQPAPSMTADVCCRRYIPCSSASGDQACLRVPPHSRVSALHSTRALKQGRTKAWDPRGSKV